MQREVIRKLKMEHGSKILGKVTIEQAYGGMRDIKGLIYETSLLDAQEGIRFRGFTIPELRKKSSFLEKGLPRLRDEPLPEGIFYLLLTGEMPTHEQVQAISEEWKDRANSFGIPEHVQKMIRGLPKDLHPMSKLSIGLLALQARSQFAMEYSAGTMSKGDLWKAAYEDTCNLLAVLPSLASLIYTSHYNKKGDVVVVVTEGDWAGRFAQQLGFQGDSSFTELLRLYLTIHVDHEGGNVSAHATKLVGSTLADPFLAYSAGLNGLAGPLHGLANQEVLAWLERLVKNIGLDGSEDKLREYLWGELKAGRVIPGYGHAVLRVTDPRYTVQRNFALRHLPNDPYFRLTSRLYEIVPKILHEQGKTKNPYPNVDAHSGILLKHYGLEEKSFYTVKSG